MTETTRAYSAYGLTIRSDFVIDDLPEVAADHGAIEIVRCSPLPAGALPGGRFDLERDRCVLDWPTVARFTLTGPDRIEVNPVEGAADDLVSLPLLGPVIALFLQRRGYLVLHGSCLDFGDGATVFLGDKGAGKSSTAAACLAAGRSLLADDVVGIRRAIDRAPVVDPASRRIKMTPETDAGLRLDWAARLPAPTPGFLKVMRDVGSAFAQGPRPLARICILRRGAEAAVTALSPREAMAAILRFSYSSRFGDYLRRTGGAADELRAAAALADRVRILTVPEGLAELGRAAERLDDLFAAAAVS